MNPSSEFLIDPRSEKELRAKLLQLAASYTPEWVPDEADPDVGLTAGLIFTSQMAGNLRRLNQVVEKYHTEFVNMLNPRHRRACGHQAPGWGRGRGGSHLRNLRGRTYHQLPAPGGMGRFRYPGADPALPGRACRAGDLSRGSSGNARA